MPKEQGGEAESAGACEDSETETAEDLSGVTVLRIPQSVVKQINV